MKNVTKIICTSAVILFASSAFAEQHDGIKDHDDWFSKCDSNSDGSISKDEFITEKTKAFEKSDINKDGKIDKEEHEKMLVEMKTKFSSHHHDD